MGTEIQHKLNEARIITKVSCKKIDRDLAVELFSSPQTYLHADMSIRNTQSANIAFSHKTLIQAHL